jgi:TM2 domain-containing membrane protein YozV
MKLINGFCLIFIFLCAVFSTDAQESGAISGMKLLAEADSLYQRQEYYAASVAYEQVCYYSESPEQSASAILKKAACLKQRGEFAMAAKRLSEVGVFGISDSLAFRVQYQSAFCYYLAADFLTASARLKNLAFRFPQPAYLTEVAFLHTLVWNELQEYDSAAISAQRYIRLMTLDKGVEDSLMQDVQTMYSPKNRPKLKSATRSEWFSRIIPGLGQTYLGYPGEGSLSFLLNAASLGLGVYGVVSGYPISGYIVGAGMLQKFYYGGLRRTAFLTGKANYERSRSFNEQVRNWLIGLPKGV